MKNDIIYLNNGYCRTREIQRLLIRLGIDMSYKGFSIVTEGVNRAVDNPDCLILISKNLYYDLAKHFNMRWQDVERNIRTVIGIAWESNPTLLSSLAGRELTAKPKVSQFLSMLAFYFMDNNNPNNTDMAG